MAAGDWAAVLLAIEEHLEALRRRCERWRHAHLPPEPATTAPATDAAASQLADLAAELYQAGLDLLQRADALRARLAPAVVDPPTTSAGAQHSLQAAERERARLARNLHDGPAQQLAQAAMQVECLERLLAHDPAAAHAELATLRASLQRAVADLRRALFDLRLPVVEQFGLVALLRAYLHEFGRQTGLHIEATLPATEPSLAREQVIALYRIAQEALTNVRKHAGARRVVLRLAEDAARGALMLEIEDDGRGFTTTAQRPGRYGLLGMHEHAALVGADLAIDGRPGQGARVVVRLPRPRA